LESNKKTEAATNTHPPTENWRGRMGNEQCAKGKRTGRPLCKFLQAVYFWNGKSYVPSELLADWKPQSRNLRSLK
jgi:hypothetical protein